MQDLKKEVSDHCQLLVELNPSPGTRLPCWISGRTTFSGTLLSSHDIIRILILFGNHPVQKTISHVHLWIGEKKRLVTVPGHREFAAGTFLSILRQAATGQREFLARESQRILTLFIVPFSSLRTSLRVSLPGCSKRLTVLTYPVQNMAGRYLSWNRLPSYEHKPIVPATRNDSP